MFFLIASMIGKSWRKEGILCVKISCLSSCDVQVMYSNDVLFSIFTQLQERNEKISAMRSLLAGVEMVKILFKKSGKINFYLLDRNL